MSNKRELSCANIYENMNFGEKESDISEAKEWLRSSFWCWINGNYVKPQGNISYSTATLRNINCQVADGYYGAATALHSSRKAQSEWMIWGLTERISILHNIFRELQKKRKLFSNLYEMLGEPDDFQLFLDYFYFYSSIVSSESEIVKPAGVVLLLLSHKTPAWFSAAVSAAALWAGCSIIIKPCEKKPFFPFLLAEICSLAGLPNGLINVVPGLKNVTDYLLSSEVDKIVYSGNFAECVGSFKTPHDFSLFDFGHTSFIIFDSCDLNGAADKLYSEMCGSGKQSTWNVDLVIVHETVYENFLKKLSRKMRAIEKSNGKFICLEKNKKYDLQKILTEAEEMGAKIFEDADNSDSGQILITEYAAEFSQLDAPITTLLVFKAAKEAIDIVNKASYRLGTSVWTENLAQAMEVASKLETSSVWINCHGVINARVPFEVFRRSGTGVMGGLDGGLAYTENKTKKGKNVQKNDQLNVNFQDSQSVRGIIVKSHNRLMEWKCCTNRKEFLLSAVELLKEINLPEYNGIELSAIVNFWAINGNAYEITMGNTDNKLYATQNKKPVGVIAMVLNDNEDNIETFTSWVAPAIAMGNVAVVVLDELSYCRLEPVIQCFLRNLPDGVLEIIRGINHAVQVARDPYTEAVWIKDENYSILGNIHLGGIYKRIWCPPTPVPLSKMLLMKHCLKNQTIWFPIINSFV